MCILPILHIVIFFAIFPCSEIIIAFKDYRYAQGIFGSAWCGLDNFRVFLSSAEFVHIAWNTVKMNAIIIVADNIAAITLAVLLYNLKKQNVNKGISDRTYNSQFYVVGYSCIYGVCIFKPHKRTFE